MAQEDDLAALRRVYEAWAAGDLTGVPPFDPHVVYISQATELDPGPHYGLETFTTYFRRFLASWDDWRMEAMEYREHGDSLVVRVRRSAVGKESRVPFEDEAFHVWTFRGGKIIRLEVFEQDEEALEAVGLRE